MILSLAVLLAPIGAFFLLWNFLTADEQVREIDPSGDYSQAAGLGLDVREPSGLSEEWKPVSSGVSHEAGAVTLRVGYHTPDGAGIQLIESDGPSEETMLQELGEAPRPSGSVAAGGREWLSYVTVDSYNAVVFSDDDLTLVVYGDAEIAELEEFAAALD